MSSLKTIFTGPPKPKVDKDMKRLQEQQLASQKAREAQQQAELASSRRARGGGGYGRSGLFYQGPAQATGDKSSTFG